jgi:hypothetical protein
MSYVDLLLVRVVVVEATGDIERNVDHVFRCERGRREPVGAHAGLAQGDAVERSTGCPHRRDRARGKGDERIPDQRGIGRAVPHRRQLGSPIGLAVDVRPPWIEQGELLDEGLETVVPALEQLHVQPADHPPQRMIDELSLLSRLAFHAPLAREDRHERDHLRESEQRVGAHLVEHVERKPARGIRSPKARDEGARVEVLRATADRRSLIDDELLTQLGDIGRESGSGHCWILDARAPVCLGRQLRSLIPAAASVRLGSRRGSSGDVHTLRLLLLRRLSSRVHVDVVHTI